MAAIDKTYLEFKDYLILKEWCENITLVYDNGVIGSPSDFLFSYNEPYEGEAPVWTTSTPFDKWLFYNCPLSFIQKRLREQYNDIEEYFSQESPKIESGNHYTLITKPKYNFRNKDIWFIDIMGKCSDNQYWFYGWDSKIWYSPNSLMPSEIKGSSAHIKNLTKRKLNRLIKNWNLPIGTILRISNRWVGSEFEIKIKK